MATNSKTMELALRTLQSMGKLGVDPMPRNYELFYAALSGQHPKLVAKIQLLGAQPAQAEIDELGDQFFPERRGESVAQETTGKISRELKDISSTFDIEQSSLSAFDRKMSQAKDNLDRANKRGSIPQDKLVEFTEAVINALSERQEQNGRVATKVKGSSNSIDRMQEELAHYKKMAVTDALSKLYNRRAFDERINEIYGMRSQQGSALIVLDIDKFKQVNDTFGHPVGDFVIASVAERIRRLVRNDTFLARTGGEEFAIVMDDAKSKDDVLRLAERIRQGVEALVLNVPKTARPIGQITVSLGACEAFDADSADDLYEKADQALYRSKQAGRNRVTFHEGASYEEDDTQRYKALYAR